MQLPEVVTRLSQQSSPLSPLYLVGGAVRDSLISKPCSDFDFVCHSDSEKIARIFADENRGAFFVLDAVRKTYRVLVNTPASTHTMFDFAAMRGDDIREDLSLRDFSINAMAVDLLKPEVVIDPFKGGRDLQQKWLRPVSQTSLLDDPLRTIRAIRYAVALDLKIEPGTSALITRAVPQLALVSPERKRDEVFKILSGKHVHLSLQLLKHFDVFRYIPIIIAPAFPALVTQARALEDMIDWLCGQKNHEKQAAFYQTSLLVEMGRFKQDFTRHYLTKNNSGRDRKSLLQLAAIIDHGAGLEEALRALALSVDEIRDVCNLRKCSGAWSILLRNESPLIPIEIYRFFRTAGSTGVDLAVKTLAEYSTKIGSEFSQDEWLRILSLCGTLLEAWFTKPELIYPAPLLNGDALIREFNLESGPMIGELLEQLIEEQVGGFIKTENQASQWIRSKLSTK